MCAEALTGVIGMRQSYVRESNKKVCLNAIFKSWNRPFLPSKAIDYCPVAIRTCICYLPT